MLMRRAIVFSVLALVLLFGIVLSLFSPGRLTCEMAKDFGYYQWSRGAGTFKAEYLKIFMRDYRFRQRFVGQPISSLRLLFPNLHSGAAYDPGSYRARNVRGFFSHYPGLNYEDFWLGGIQNDFGSCVLVVDGRIADFFFVKG